MSIGLATMGKFRYQFHQNRQFQAEGGSDGWWQRKRPTVVIRSVIEDDKYKYNQEKPVVEITEITNGNKL